MTYKIIMAVKKLGWIAERLLRRNVPYDNNGEYDYFCSTRNEIIEECGEKYAMIWKWAESTYDSCAFSCRIVDPVTGYILTSFEFPMFSLEQYNRAQRYRQFDQICKEKPNGTGYNKNN